MPALSEKLILLSDEGEEQAFDLEASAVEIGRASTNHIVLRDAMASRNHARLEREAGGYALVDLGAPNGVWINGVRVQRQLLAPGDVVRIGDSHLRYEVRAPQDEAAPMAIDSEAQLEATLMVAALDMTVNDTRSSRITVHSPEGTWERSLRAGGATIGREPNNDIVLKQTEVSRQHAVIAQEGEDFVIRDLGSTNGTWLGGQRIEKVRLRDGDTIRIGDARLLFKSGFEPEALTIVAGGMTAVAAPRYPVVIVPGLMGSELWQGEEKIWPNVRMLFRQPELLRLPDGSPLEPRGLVREVVIVPNLIKQAQYNRLGDYLEEGLGYERGKDLIEFAYDWRQDVRQSARKLAETIENWGVNGPVILVAHSLGCLVSRYYVNRLVGKKKVGRVILLGGPHGGAPKAMTTLLLKANLLPFGFLGERLRDVLITFPSMYQILPTYACAVDQRGQSISLLEDDQWLSEAQRPYLNYARDYWREVGSSLDVPSVSIFGYGISTIVGASVRRDDDGRWLGVDLRTDTAGDATVPERSAVLPGSEIHPVQQNHGSLYVDNDVKMRLKLELTRPLL